MCLMCGLPAGATPEVIAAAGQQKTALCLFVLAPSILHLCLLPFSTFASPKPTRRPENVVCITEQKWAEGNGIDGQ